MKKSTIISFLNGKTLIDVYHVLSGTHWIVSNTPTVKSILNSKNTHFVFNTNKRLRTFISYNGNYDKYRKPYFAPVIYACYHENLTAKNFYKKIPLLLDYWRKNDLHIEHLDGNKYNNTIFNLSLMKQEDNQKKRFAEKHFKGIFHLLQAYDGEGYKVQLTYISNVRRREIKAIKYYCDTPEELNRLIKYLKANKWKVRENREGIEIENTYFVSGDFFPKLKFNSDTFTMQKDLAYTPKKEFTILEDKTVVL